MTPISLLLHLFQHPRICGLFASILRKLLQSLQYFLKCFRGVVFFFFQAHGIQGVLQTLPVATEDEGKVILLFFSSVLFFF